MFQHLEVAFDEPDRIMFKVNKFVPGVKSRYTNPKLKNALMHFMNRRLLFKRTVLTGVVSTNSRNVIGRSTNREKISQTLRGS
jgi:hypothetical protein